MSTEVTLANEINQINYEEKVKEVIELLKIADFVAIDATVETTGLLLKNENFNLEDLPHVDDSLGEWYDEIKKREKTSCLLEVGIAIFKRVPNTPGELEVEAFNIPVLPACVDDNELARFRGNTWTRITLEGYGQEFINQVEFDINKVFYLGAPYINKQLQERADEYMKNNPDFMVAVRKRRLNPYLMPVLYKEVEEDQRKEIVQRLKGICKIFEAISKFGLPVVGHHLLLKLIFIYKDFFEYLPQSYPECSEIIRRMFRLIYDTKYIVSEMASFPKIPLSYRARFADHTLYELYRNLNFEGDLRKFKVYVGGRSSVYMEDILDFAKGEKLEEDQSSFCYVAGFDALVTGLAFLDIVSILEVSAVDCWTEAECQGHDYLDLFLKGSPARFKNKIYMDPRV